MDPGLYGFSWQIISILFKNISFSFNYSYRHKETSGMDLVSIVQIQSTEHNNKYYGWPKVPKYVLTFARKRTKSNDKTVLVVRQQCRSLQHDFSDMAELLLYYTPATIISMFNAQGARWGNHRPPTSKHWTTCSCPESEPHPKKLVKLF